MSEFKKGDEVVQVVSAPIRGKVLGFAVDQESGETQVRVGYTDEDGQEHVRHFLSSQLKKA